VGFVAQNGSQKVTFDPEMVRAFEHAGWQQAAADYDATFARATAGFVEALLDAAGVGAGSRLFDLCCGTGIVGAVAAQHGAMVTGLDFSPAMLGRARAAHPSIPFDEGDAEALPYDEARFDAVVSNFGVHHIPRPGRALAEMHRVLRPGGRFAFTSWAAPAENVAWRLLFDAIAAHGDLAAAKTPPSGGNLGRREAVLQLLDDSGFAETGVGEVHREWSLAGAEELVAALRRGTVRTAALIAAQAPAALPTIIAEIDRNMAIYRSGRGFAVPIVAMLASGTKSAR
jgi:ubiquinone/menaquinone biosynthesis C-methylase UbiE